MKKEMFLFIAFLAPLAQPPALGMDNFKKAKQQLKSLEAWRVEKEERLRRLNEKIGTIQNTVHQNQFQQKLNILADRGRGLKTLGEIDISKQYGSPFEVVISNLLYYIIGTFSENQDLFLTKLNALENTVEDTLNKEKEEL